MVLRPTQKRYRGAKPSANCVPGLDWIDFEQLAIHSTSMADANCFFRPSCRSQLGSKLEAELNSGSSR
jgi:hypothetical protein